MDTGDGSFDNDPSRLQESKPEDTNDHSGVDRCVDTDRQIVGVLKDDGSVEVVESDFRPETVLQRKVRQFTSALLGNMVRTAM